MSYTRVHKSVQGHLTIIPQARVWYEMVDSQRGALSAELAQYNHLISNKGEWNNVLLKTPPKQSKLNLKKK